MGEILVTVGAVVEIESEDELVTATVGVAVVEVGVNDGNTEV